MAGATFAGLVTTVVVALVLNRGFNALAQGMIAGSVLNAIVIVAVQAWRRRRR